MRFAPIKAIFYSEFHPIQGPVVVYSVPEGSVVSGRPNETHKDDIVIFEHVSEYVIPKPALCNRLVSLTATSSRTIIGHPVSIEDAKYERNAFLFNLVFVFDSNDKTQPYEQVVRKMSRILRSLELESGLLSNKDTKPKVFSIMDQLLQDLNTYSNAESISVEFASPINLKLFQSRAPPATVHDWQVPVQVYHLARIVDRLWDMTILRVIPFINGALSVKRISEIADVELGLVRLSIQHLLYYGCVKLVDIFQYSNIYTLKSNNMLTLLENEDLQYEMLAFVRKDEHNISTLFTLLSSLKPGLTVKEWCEEHDVRSLNIDIRRLFVFGVLNNFLYRVHKYPVTSSTTVGSPTSMDLKKLSRFLDGKHHFDGLYCH
ncbi:nitrogen permease regulator 2 [Rhizoclosmatium globosum]|uniref:Nitrogen permease regulator 2 n=1 Tax=Rhizoclosmatium globosum TaxID=329046 RepID=A0A1Y2CV73_9FUNG|nr:nitrogen permease regulator 2 [Rhizoclosmatium globosum]|eukprot:ORY50867.1 nitrogen permease regulator 2 [Rhizoclosmatium globosum]